MTDYEWLTAGAENGGSKIYKVLDAYQQEGYHELAGIASSITALFLWTVLVLARHSSA